MKKNRVFFLIIGACILVSSVSWGATPAYQLVLQEYWHKNRDKLVQDLKDKEVKATEYLDKAIAEIRKKHHSPRIFREKTLKIHSKILERQVTTLKGFLKELDSNSLQLLVQHLRGIPQYQKLRGEGIHFINQALDLDYKTMIEAQRDRLHDLTQEDFVRELEEAKKDLATKYNPEYILAMSKETLATDMPMPYKIILFPVAVVVDLALFPFELLAAVLD